MNVLLKAYTPDPDHVIATAARQCYAEGFVGDNWDFVNEASDAKLIEKIINCGHTSCLEHASFTFAIEGVSRACYDKETEIYTNNGWKLFKDVEETDLVMTRNDKGETEFHKPTSFIQYRYTGNLHSYKSQNVDLRITPNHNLFMKNYDVAHKVDYNLKSSESIKVNRFYIPKLVKGIPNSDEFITIEGDSYIRASNSGGEYVKEIPDLTLDKKTFLKLLAWYLSEGSTYYNQAENSYAISITQTKCSEGNIQNRTEIFELIKKLGFNPWYEENNIKFKSRQLGIFFKSLGISNKKYIPYDIFSIFDKDLALEFLSTYSKADASIDKKGHVKLYTTSKTLADQLQMIVFIAGYSAAIWEDDRVGQTHFINGNKVKHNHICYVVSLSTSYRNMECVIKKDKHFSEVFYDDDVYCVEVINHVIFVRRNGIAVWCGNCSHQLVRFRHASFSQQSQRYVTFNKEFEYITPPSIAADPELLSNYESHLNMVHKLYEKFVQRGIPAEDARFIAPNACETKIIVTMNAREIHHACSLRECNHAQWEIKELFETMNKLVKPVAPVTFAKLGPSCVTKGVCSEGPRCCGRINSIN